MDTFELNKFAGAVLFALLILFGAKTATDLFFRAHAPEKPGYVVAVADGGGEQAAAQAEPEEVDLAVLLASADVGKGERQAKKCTACHTFDQGGANRIGPNLFGTVGRELGAVEGFAYSSALIEKGGTWDYEALDAFIANPKAFIAGTKMAFAGIKKADQRADLILYLREQGAEKPPLPEPKAKDEAQSEEKEAQPGETKDEAKAEDKEASVQEKQQ